MLFFVVSENKYIQSTGHWPQALFSLYLCQYSVAFYRRKPGASNLKKFSVIMETLQRLVAAARAKSRTKLYITLTILCSVHIPLFLYVLHLRPYYKNNRTCYSDPNHSIQFNSIFCCARISTKKFFSCTNLNENQQLESE